MVRQLYRPPAQERRDTPSAFTPSLEAASPAVLQGPARVLRQQRVEAGSASPPPAGSENEQRVGGQSAASRSQSAPARTKEVTTLGLSGCCTDIRGRLENCQIVAHDSERHTIRNLRQQALPPPPQPRSDVGLPPEAEPTSLQPRPRNSLGPALQIETENLDAGATGSAKATSPEPFHVEFKAESKAWSEVVQYYKSKETCIYIYISISLSINK